MIFKVIIFVSFSFVFFPPLSPPAGEAVQRDDRGRPGLRQRQQALCQWHQGPVPAVQEGGGDFGERRPQTQTAEHFSLLAEQSRICGHSCRSPYE